MLMTVSLQDVATGQRHIDASGVSTVGTTDSNENLICGTVKRRTDVFDANASV
jgi:hypothetical protein